MSILKATWWRPATALGVLALAVLALSLSGAGTAHAGDPGSVSIVPAQKDIAVGGEGDVRIDIDPPAAGTSIWIIQVKYDPAVVQVKTTSDPDHPIGCTGMANPGQGIAQAASCDVKDTNSDQKADTAVAFGGWVQNDGGTAKGFTSIQTAATFTFVAVQGAAAGAHSDLTVTVSSMLGPNGQNETPTANNGAIDIIAAQGMTVTWGDGDCNTAVNPVDALKTLKVDAGQTVNQTVAGCPAYNSNITVNGLTVPWGDFDCNGSTNPVDALKLLKVDAGQTVNQGVANCPAYNSQVQITT